MKYQLPFYFLDPFISNSSIVSLVHQSNHTTKESWEEKRFPSRALMTRGTDRSVQCTLYYVTKNELYMIIAVMYVCILFIHYYMYNQINSSKFLSVCPCINKILIVSSCRYNKTNNSMGIWTTYDMLDLQNKMLPSADFVFRSNILHVVLTPSQ